MTQEPFSSSPLTATYAACVRGGGEPGAALPWRKLHWQWVFPKKKKKIKIRCKLYFYFHSTTSHKSIRCCPSRLSEAAEPEFRNTCLAFSLLPQGLCFGFSHLCFLSPSFPSPFKRKTSNTAKQEGKFLAALSNRRDDGTWGRM